MFYQASYKKRIGKFFLAFWITNTTNCESQSKQQLGKKEGFLRCPKISLIDGTPCPYISIDQCIGCILSILFCPRAKYKQILYCEGIFPAGFWMFFILKPTMCSASKCPNHRYNETVYPKNLRYHGFRPSFEILALRSQKHYWF